MPEVSRDYLEQKLAQTPGYSYEEADLLKIARAQLQAEIATSGKQPGLIICDTDLLVIMIWSEVRFGHCHPWILDTFSKQAERGNRTYLLCDHDVPWAPDPLRESESSRAELFGLYREKLDSYKLDYHLISGSVEDRIETCRTLFPQYW